MKNNHRLISGVILVLSVALFSGGCADVDEAQKDNSDQGYLSEVGEDEDAVASEIGRENSGLVHAKVSDEILNSYLCESERCEENSFLNANSKDEALWLLNHGYPTRDEMTRLKGLPFEELKREADGGSLPAIVLYGERYAINSGDALGGASIIRQAIDKGSLYGYYGLASIYSADIVDKNMIDAAAYLRLAYIHGDYKAADELAIHFSEWGAADFMLIDRRAYNLYINEGSRQAFPRPM